MEKNLTTGSVLKNTISFSLPYLLSFFMQTLYGLADVYIVGRFNETSSTTAVSIGSQAMHMLTVMIVGLAMGTTVNIGRAIGENRKDKMAKTIGNTITIFLISALCLMALLIALVKPIVSVLSTPTQAIEETTAYLIICFAGIPFITAYNVISSIFRGMGDSKTPMYFIFVACVSNIALDFLFIGGMGLGAKGAALGTICAQAISVFSALAYIRLSKNGFVSLSKSDLKPNKSTTSSILKVGFPIAIQDGFIQVAFIVITIIANRRGLDDSAAVGIVEKIIGGVFLIPSTMLSTVSALCSQNLGAGKIDRAKKTLLYANAICIGYGLALGIVVSFCAPQLVGLFTKSESVSILGGQYLKSYIWDCMLAGVHFCFSGYFCALQKSQISFLHNAISIVFARIPLSYLFSKMYPQNLFPMGSAAPIGSFLSVVICVVAYLIIEHKRKTAITN